MALWSCLCSKWFPFETFLLPVYLLRQISHLALIFASCISASVFSHDQWLKSNITLAAIKNCHWNSSRKSQSVLFIQHTLGDCCCSLPSFVSFRKLVIKEAVAQGVHSLPIIKFEHGDEINLFLPCKWARRVISSFSLFPLASKTD